MKKIILRKDNSKIIIYQQNGKITIYKNHCKIVDNNAQMKLDETIKHYLNNNYKIKHSFT